MRLVGTAVLRGWRTRRGAWRPAHARRAAGAACRASPPPPAAPGPPPPPRRGRRGGTSVFADFPSGSSRPPHAPRVGWKVVGRKARSKDRRASAPRLALTTSREGGRQCTLRCGLACAGCLLCDVTSASSSTRRAPRPRHGRRLRVDLIAHSKLADRPGPAGHRRGRRVVWGGSGEPLTPR